MTRLGFWQLDRLEQRRARNAQLSQQLALPPFSLSGDPLPEAPSALKNRLATAQGEFDFSYQVILKLQNRTETGGLVSPLNAVGVDLITPFVIEGTSKAVLVDRGWIPESEAALDNLTKFSEPAGQTTVTGRIQLSQTLPSKRATAIAPKAASGSLQREWYRVDIEAIQAQIPYELLPIYIEQSPTDNSQTTLPYRSEPTFDLSEGPHLGYAIQWFTFALIFGGGYLYYVRNNTLKTEDQLPHFKESHEREN
jgi:surfeit locus 1 family protein